MFTDKKRTKADDVAQVISNEVDISCLQKHSVDVFPLPTEAERAVVEAYRKTVEHICPQENDSLFAAEVMSKLDLKEGTEYRILTEIDRQLKFEAHKDTPLSEIIEQWGKEGIRGENLERRVENVQKVFETANCRKIHHVEPRGLRTPIKLIFPEKKRYAVGEDVMKFLNWLKSKNLMGEIQQTKLKNFPGFNFLPPVKSEL
jgi:hypothetical protein